MKTLLLFELGHQIQSFQDNDFIYGENYTTSFLKSVGIAKLSVDDAVNQDLRGKLVRLFHRGQIVTMQTMISRLDGDFSFRPNDTLFATAINQLESGEIDLIHASDVRGSEEHVSDKPKPPQQIRCFSQIYLDVIDFLKETGEWKGQTVKQNTTTLERFLEVAGDKPVNEYNRSDISTFIGLIRKLPKDWGRSQAIRSLPIKDIIKKYEGLEVETLALNTLKRHHRALSKFFSHLLNEGVYDGENPASGYKFPKDKLKRSKRQAWSEGKLKKLFGSPNWQGAKSKVNRSKPGTFVTKDEKYWLPILALFQGNRLEEFAQLRRSDIMSENGLAYFYIHGAGGRQIKNEQSERKLPIHPFILKLGFLNYVKRATKSADDRVFPNLKPGGADKKYGFSYTKWFSRYRQDISVFEKGVDYHSFRHGFVTQLRNKGVASDVVERLVGHDSGESTNSSVYLKEFDLRKLAEAISILEWPEVEQLLLQKNE